MVSVTVVQGSEQDLANTTASNDTRWTGDDDGAGAEFIFRCTPADTTAEPGDLHFEGYYDEPGAPKTNGATVYVYNWQTAAWVSHITLTDSADDETHDVSLTHADGAPGSGTLETVPYTIGDVLIKVQQNTTETGNACLLIDRMYVGFISAPVTAAEIADATWEEAQADHVSVGTFGIIASEIAAIPTTPMRGTDGVSLVIPDASGTAAGLHGTTDGLIGAIPTNPNTVVPDVAGTAATLHGTTDGKVDALVATVGVAGAGLTAINLPDQTMNITGDITGSLSGSVGSVTGHTNQTGDSYPIVSHVTYGNEQLGRTGADSDTLETLSDQIDAIMGSTGTGARTVAVTVNDGAAVLENAVVRYTEGANTYNGETDVSGEISFSLDDATYSVAISKVGYTFTPTTLLVDGNKTPTYSMSVVTITAPPNAATTTGVMTVYDEEGVVESGVTMTVQIIAGPGTAGIGYDSTEWAATSSALGVVEFAGIILGAQYKIWRGTAKAAVETFTAPTTGDSFDLTEVIGRG